MRLKTIAIRTSASVAAALLMALALSSCGSGSDGGGSKDRSNPSAGSHEAATGETRASGSIWAYQENFSDGIHKLENLPNVVETSGEVALDAEGHVWLWDPYNDHSMIDGLNDVVDIASDSGHVFVAATRGGEVYQYPEDGSDPIKVDGLSDITKVGAGDLAYFAIDKQGAVWAWGKGAFGELGDGVATCCGDEDEHIVTRPIKVDGLPPVVDVRPERGMLALDSTGAVWYWGSTDRDGSNDFVGIKPTKVELDQPITMITGSGESTGGEAFGVTTSGRIYSLHNAVSSQFNGGTNPTEGAPTTIDIGAAPQHASAIAFAGEDLFAITDDGKVWAWYEVDESPMGFSELPEPTGAVALGHGDDFPSIVAKN